MISMSMITFAPRNERVRPEIEAADSVLQLSGRSLDSQEATEALWAVGELALKVAAGDVISPKDVENVFADHAAADVSLAAEVIADRVTTARRTTGGTDLVVRVGRLLKRVRRMATRTRRPSTLPRRPRAQCMRANARRGTRSARRAAGSGIATAQDPPTPPGRPRDKSQPTDSRSGLSQSACRLEESCAHAPRSVVRAPDVAPGIAQAIERVPAAAEQLERIINALAHLLIAGVAGKEEARSLTRRPRP